MRPTASGPSAPSTRGAAHRRLHGAAVLVLLPVQRLALDVLRRQRPRGRLGDGVRSTSCPTGTAGCGRPGSGRRRTTSPASTCAAAGTTPQLRREGDHPVIYPGAGSHSGAFLPGDYVVSVELPALRRVVNWSSTPAGGCCPGPRSRGAGRSRSRSSTTPAATARRSARHQLTWQLDRIGDDTPWVRDYRGLWGLDTHDHFGGERAPAGPRYERTGTPRRSWTDPLGWVGLDGVPATPRRRSSTCGPGSP